MSSKISRKYARLASDLQLSKVKVGIIGHSDYDNELEVRNFFVKLKEYPARAEILCPASKVGADLYTKYYALQYELNYKEYAPLYTCHNQYSALPRHLYQKQYAKKYEFSRYKTLIKESNVVVIFDKPNLEDDFIKYCKKECKKQKKPLIVKL